MCQAENINQSSAYEEAHIYLLGVQVPDVALEIMWPFVFNQPQGTENRESDIHGTVGM